MIERQQQLFLYQYFDQYVLCKVRLVGCISYFLPLSTIYYFLRYWITRRLYVPPNKLPPQNSPLWRLYRYHVVRRSWPLSSTVISPTGMDNGRNRWQLQSTMTSRRDTVDNESTLA
jgi:hypothetical protein